MKLAQLFVGLILFAVILLVSFNFLFNHSLSLSNFEPGTAARDNVPFSRLFAVALSMLIGILFGAFYNLIKNKEPGDSVSADFKKLFQSAQLFKSLVAAPIVFSAVYVSTRTEPDQILALVFAFQNGFFCDTIMRTKEPINSG